MTDTSTTQSLPVTAPWRVEDTGMPDSLTIMAAQREGYPDEDRWIAFVNADEEKGIGLDEMRANAKLIAAAPLMLAALEDADSILAGIEGCPEHMEPRASIRAAIAAALADQ